MLVMRARGASAAASTSVARAQTRPARPAFAAPLQARPYGVAGKTGCFRQGPGVALAKNSSHASLATEEPAVDVDIKHKSGGKSRSKRSSRSKAEKSSAQVQAQYIAAPQQRALHATIFFAPQWHTRSQCRQFSVESQVDVSDDYADTEDEGESLEEQMADAESYKAPDFGPYAGASSTYAVPQDMPPSQPGKREMVSADAARGAGLTLQHLPRMP